MRWRLNRLQFAHVQKQLAHSQGFQRQREDLVLAHADLSRANIHDEQTKTHGGNHLEAKHHCCWWMCWCVALQSQGVRIFVSMQGPSGFRLPVLSHFSSLLSEDEGRGHDSVGIFLHDSGNGGFVRFDLDRIGIDQVVDLNDLGFNEHAFLSVAQFLPVQFLPTLFCQVSQSLVWTLELVEAVGLGKLGKQVDVSRIGHYGTLSFIVPLGDAISAPQAKCSCDLLADRLVAGSSSPRFMPKSMSRASSSGSLSSGTSSGTSGTSDTSLPGSGCPGVWRYTKVVPMFSMPTGSRRWRTLAPISPSMVMSSMTRPLSRSLVILLTTALQSGPFELVPQ